jgi:hypothetical protein
MKRIGKSIILLIIVAIICVLAYSAIFPHIARGVLVEYSDFEEISDRVFVSPETSPGQRDSLLAYLDTAHARNVRFWGERVAYPKVVFCHSLELAEKYGYAGSPASFFMTPLFSFVMIVPEGLHPDIISHEMCHPELYQRAGWAKHTLAFPVWFFEGVAMQVDHRLFYSETAWQNMARNGRQAPLLTDIHKPEGFFSGDFQMNYATAKREVTRWLEVVGPEGLKRLIEETTVTGDFYQVYQAIEQKQR